jgi:hypothetical protein
LYTNFQEDALSNDIPSPCVAQFDRGPAGLNATAQLPQGPHSDADRLTSARQRLQQAHTSYRALLMSLTPARQRPAEPTR